MLIVPAEYRFDSRHLPWGTLLLFFLCTLIFALYQSGDDARTEAALSVYSSRQLLDYEQTLLQSYLETQGISIDAGLAAEFPAAVLDRGFDARVHDDWMRTPPTPEWQAARALFEAARNRISWQRFGLVPADVRPAALLGHMFLHGGFAHLLGNMIFLVLFGMLLERVLGTALFIGAYLVTGLLAAGLFVLANAGSTVPLIGASGAISGLMGAYLGVYGLRRVEFFYTAGFWFGKFTAPAILVFPLWLAKELYGYFNDAGPVAYMAHAGGLAGGLLLAMLLKKQAARTIDADTETERNRKSTRERLVRIRQLMTDLHLDEAVRLAEQSIRQSPKEAEYWRVYADVAGRLAISREYHRVMTTLFVNANQKAMSVEFLREVLAAYRARSAGSQPALQGAGGAGLARRFFHEGSTRDLDQLLDGIFHARGLSKDFGELLHMLLAFAEKNSDRRRAQRYRQYLAAIGAAGSDQAVSGPS